MIERPIVDVSHWQPHGGMNWGKAKAAGILGVIAKAGQGSHSQDPEFAWHVYGASQAGIDLWGAYLFLDNSDPQAQAQNLVDTVKAEFNGSVEGVLLALDAESNKDNTASIETVAAVAQAVREMVGRWPVLYMGRYGPDGAGTDLPNPTLSLCPLWLPSYGPTMHLPPGFTKACLWQDTDGTMNHGAAVDGLGRVDQSRVVGMDEAALRTWWGT